MENITDKLIDSLKSQYLDCDCSQFRIGGLNNMIRNLLILMKYDYQYEYYWKMCLLTVCPPIMYKDVKWFYKY